MSEFLPSIIHYFHDCYQSDNRDLFISDFLSTKVEDKVYYEGEEELLTGTYPIVHIDSQKAEKILKKVEVFKKEKELIYGTFFIVGNYINFRGETKRLCAPLFYYPASIEQREDFHYLSIDTQRRKINYPLLSLLSQETDKDIFGNKLFHDLPLGNISFGEVSRITNYLEEYFPDVNTEELYSYPENLSIKFVKKIISKFSDDDLSQRVIVPTGIVGIISKSAQTRGVLNELKDLAKKNEFSLSLRTLFSHQEWEKKEYKKGQLPMILSSAQQKILKSSSTNPLTLVIGPPGTGKTYTIGAIAIEHMSRGESVLIASRTDEAVDVVTDKITSQMGSDRFIMRGSRKRAYATRRNRYIKALLTRSSALVYLIKELGLKKGERPFEVYNRLDELKKVIEKNEALLEKIEANFLKEVGNEIEWGKHLDAQSSSFWDQARTKYLEFRNKWQTPLWELSEQLFATDQDQILMNLDTIRLKYVGRIDSVVKSYWNDIKLFSQAIRDANDTERLKKFNEINFNAVLKAFPIWLTNLSEVNDMLPFQSEMFDVVIIDETTQCDIASCLPLIQRAKRVVFAGDPAQLRHISFLSKGIQNLLKDKYELSEVDSYKLNYRDNSMLDLVMNSLTAGDQVHTLDEHFRSLPPIIAFSNRMFYDNGLKIMTLRPEKKEQAISVYKCRGKREKKGTNEKEAFEIIKNITASIETEREISADLCTSIGVISPFRNQVDFLSKLIVEKFTIEEIEKHELKIGTAYSFQGEEKDEMHLSFTVDEESHHSAFTHINKDDVFNVAVTRARIKQHIYISLELQKLKHDSLLRRYLRETVVVEKENTQLHHDAFLNEVKSILEKWEIEYWVAFPVAGLKIDLLVKYEERYLGIDLVGYPGDFEESFGIERYRILNRAGIKAFPLPYSDWYFDQENTSDSLREFIIP